MVEKLIKVFTRDFSLFTVEWWRSELMQKFQQAVGVGYKDAPIASNGKAVTAFYLESDSEIIRDASIETLRKGYYFGHRAEFLANTAESKRLVEELADTELTPETIAVIRSRFFTIFPMTRFTVFTPHFWVEEVGKKLGAKAKPLITATLEDREKSEGVAEKIDSLLRKLASKKLVEIGKPAILAKFLTNGELEALANGEKIDWDEVKTRTGGYVYCKGKLYPTVDYLRVFRENGYLFNEEKVFGNELKGTVAVQGGVVKGNVRVIYALEQLGAFRKGEVMVTPMTVPDFIPAMKTASAVVTDEGGVTCHAAIVCRELSIPCIIGTRVATKLFKDGDEIEVDTTSGVVKKL